MAVVHKSQTPKTLKTGLKLRNRKVTEDDKAVQNRRARRALAKIEREKQAGS